MDRDRALLVAVEAARAAGEILLAGLGAPKHAGQKAHRHDPVTLYDRRAEETIVSSILEAFPDHGILGEEGTCRESSSGYRWVIDPLDGTNNYLRGFPQFGVSIALERAGLGELACVHDPLRRELFTAMRGEGAWLNGCRVHVSGQRAIDGALIGVGYSSRPERALRVHDAFRRLIPHIRGGRCAGAASLDLAYVASGRLDGCWYVSLSRWDVAAGTLLVTEAGGRVSDLEGAALEDPESGIVASNGSIHDGMTATLRPNGDGSTDA